jgi:hypothetical protein
LVAVRSLSDSDVATVQAELSAGKQPTVWFTPAAVGMRPGGSAKVISLGEQAEGEFIKVKPAGSRDTMFCSANELTTTRPPRKRATAKAEDPPPPAAPARAAAPREKPATPPGPAPAPAAGPTAGTPAKPTAGPAPGTPAQPTAAKVTAPPAEAPAQPRRTTDRRRPPAEFTVTLSASAEGDWTVEATVGKKRTVRPLPVQPSEVAAAARALPAPIAEAIEASLTTARKRQVERVEHLQAELEAAQQALRELGG